MNTYVHLYKEKPYAFAPRMYKRRTNMVLIIHKAEISKMTHCKPWSEDPTLTPQHEELILSM